MVLSFLSLNLFCVIVNWNVSNKHLWHWDKNKLFNTQLKATLAEWWGFCSGIRMNLWDFQMLFWDILHPEWSRDLQRIHKLSIWSKMSKYRYNLLHNFVTDKLFERKYLVFRGSPRRSRLNWCRCLGSTIAESLVKFQSDLTISTSKLVAAELRDRTQRLIVCTLLKWLGVARYGVICYFILQLWFYPVV